MKIKNSQNLQLNIQDSSTLYFKKPQKPMQCPMQLSFKGTSMLSDYNSTCLKMRQDDKYLLSENEFKKLIQMLKKTYRQHPCCNNLYGDLQKILEDNTALKKFSYVANAVDMTSQDEFSVNDFLYFMELTHIFRGNGNHKKYLKSDFLFAILAAFKDNKTPSHGIMLKQNLSQIDFMSEDEIDELDKFARNDLTRQYMIEFAKESAINEKYSANFLPELLYKTKTVFEFTEINHSGLFYDCFKNRKSVDIEIMTNLLSEFLSNATLDDAKELNKIIKPLFEAKTPEGDFVFTTCAQSDTGQKNSFDGIFNIIEAYKNNKNKYKKLIKYLQMIQEGQIPSYILGVSPKVGDVTKQTEIALFNRFNNKNNITEYLNPKDAMCSIEAGDVVNIGGKLFYRNTRKLLSLKMDEKTFKLLFPDIESLAISQGENGNCYFVSAVYDFMSNLDTRGIIYQMFEQNGDKIKVTVPNAQNTPVEYDNNDILGLKHNPQSINAALGIKLLEDAYAKTVGKKCGATDKPEVLNGGSQAFLYNAFLDNSNSKSYIQSACCEEDSVQQENRVYNESLKAENERRKKQIEELEALLADQETILKQLHPKINKREFQQVKDNIDKLNEGILLRKRALEENPEVEFILQGSLAMKLCELKESKKIVSAGSKILEDCDEYSDFDNDRLIYPSHAYSIGDVNSNNQTIEIINPWNTAFSSILSFEEFNKFFDMLCSCDLP